jgi:phage shock protein A
MGEQQKEQLEVVANLKQNMRQLESKVIDLKTKKRYLHCRAGSAQATLKLSDLLDSSGTSERDVTSFLNAWKIKY